MIRFQRLRQSAIFAGFFLVSCSTVPKVTYDLKREFQQLERGQSVDSAKLKQACDSGATAACVLLGQSVRPERQLAILQGPTSATHTVLSAVTPRNSKLLYVVLASGREGDSQARVWKVIESVESRGRLASQWQVDHLQISGLQKEVIYSLWVVNERGELIDQREFRALDLQKSSPRLIVASCLDDGYLEEQRTAWVEVRQLKPDAIFLIGDNVYGDKYLGAVLEGAEPNGLWSRYVHTRHAVDFYRWETLTPIFAVWDDHDYGRNSGDRNYRYRNEARDIFLAFFPFGEVEGSWLSLGPGVASYLRAFGMEFAFLDDRSFRSPNNEAGAQSHLGEIQTQWLREQAARSTSPLFLILGNQFFGGYHKYESWEGSHPEDFKNFRAWLKKTPRPVFFLSGDRHLTELLKVTREDVGQETYELTTSAIHARTFPGALLQWPTARRLEGAAGPKNFAELSPSLQGHKLRLKVRVFGVGQGVLYERHLLISGQGSRRQR